MPIQLRQATINDLETVRQIGIDTFYESFASVNTEENMADYLKTGFSMEKVASELGNADSEFHLAYDGDQLIGYLKVNHGPAQSELKDDTALEIERIYVLRAWQGLKVGQLFYNKAIDIARERGYAYVWLGVWEENENAIGFYKRNGFVEFDKHLFTLGDDIQTDIMMRKEL
ncbi:GNAT family N-acetyltransferase [Dyadobacter jiangsuensis]|uniref:Ribosomal protein S18 acetylase RimI-like enzyme n=1 Tax=Dyadobacter jiangsuensis TaxID=1591085 RepID=A0A2P8FV57_9BACT|nr:GNAT family N-acetyltransferase [Dyadobacter jiangsuensis]PSL25612.1 ribosomal protein S18 acetylase RimI-like enzyme [Dyadobacter jiangsuensis]